MKKTIYILFWALLITSTFVLLGFIHGKYNRTNLKHIKVQVAYHGPDTLIHVDDINNIINSSIDSIFTKKVSKLNLHALENKLAAHPYVRAANAFTSLNGELHIHIDQVLPLARLINKQGIHFYLDETLCALPIFSQKVAKVPIVNGKMAELNFCNPQAALMSSIVVYSENISIYLMAAYIRSHDLLRNLIGQIYIKQWNNYELIPKLGTHYVEFGSCCHMETKFENLQVFYQEGLGNCNWNKYKKISLTYENQIICTKK